MTTNCNLYDIKCIMYNIMWQSIIVKIEDKVRKIKIERERERKKRRH